LITRDIHQLRSAMVRPLRKESLGFYHPVLRLHDGPQELQCSVNARHAMRRLTDSTRSRRRSELETFATTMRILRKSLGREQRRMAALLEVSQRTLSDWENQHAIPDVKERLHFLHTLHGFAPDYVETFAAIFGLDEHPGVTPLLPKEEPEAPPPAPPLLPVVVEAAPPPLPPSASSREEVALLVDRVVREAADAVDVRASDLRRGVHAVLEAVAEKGATLDDARAVLAAAVRAKRGR
jgi:DNA-binding transcriptional regulator YiaG